MELILRIELKTSPLPRECSTAELYEHVFNNHKKQLMDLLKKISRYSNTKTDCRDDLLIIFAMLYMERVAGIEPASLAWKAKVLPLYHTRNYSYSRGL